MEPIAFFKPIKMSDKGYPHKENNNHNGNHKMSPELKMGIKVESEHKDTLDFLKHHVKEHGKFPKDKKVYKFIAKDHLRERPDYYKKLAECVEND